MALTKREIREGIRVVEKLLQEWDPIGLLPEEPGSPAWREYDRYAPQIFGMLVHGAGEPELLGHLRWISTDMMGLSPNDVLDQEAANALLKWWRNRGG